MRKGFMKQMFIVSSTKKKTWIHQGNYEGEKIGFLIADKMGRRSRDESGLRDGITDKKRTTTTRDLSH